MNENFYPNKGLWRAKRKGRLSSIILKIMKVKKKVSGYVLNTRNTKIAHFGISVEN
jgi:hypothetical protein